MKENQTGIISTEFTNSLSPKKLTRIKKYEIMRADVQKK